MRRFWERAMTISELLAERAREHGNRTFVLFDHKEIGFQEFSDTSGRVAANLAARGVGKGEKVVLMMGNCLEFLYCFFGFGRIGAVMVPVNPTLSFEEYVFIINDSDAVALVIPAEFAPLLPRLRDALPKIRHFFIVDGEAEGAEPFSVLTEPVEIPETMAAGEASDAALIYTSGTTGAPKGVILTHGNYYWNTLAMAHSNRLSRADRFLCILPLFHVNAQVVSVLTPLMVGGSVAVMGGRFTPFGIFPAIEEYRPTIMSAVPTIYGIMCRLPKATSYDISSIRFFVSGAAPLPEEIYNAVRQVLKKTLIMGYGLSEATCASAVADHEDPIRWNSVGPALRYTGVRIVNEDGQDVPVGGVGEILVSGPTVMKGYYNNPEATAEVLQNGWLKTGDLGRLDNQGYLYVVDRVKDMIIRGGQNIYPAQIEQVIIRLPQVDEVAVVGVPEPTWGQEVLAVIKLLPEATLTEKEVFDFCKEHLGAYKRPKFVRFVEELPKTAIGKVRKNELAKQYADLCRHSGGSARS